MSTNFSNRGSGWLLVVVFTVIAAASTAQGQAKPQSAPASQPLEQEPPASQPGPPPPREGDQQELRRRVDVLTDEVQRLKEQLVLPDKKEDLQSMHGLGPAASKIYGVGRGISFAGYGEFYIQRHVKDNTTGKDFSIGDFYRYIQYVGYKFTDKLLVNAEIEFEHTTTGTNYAGKGGSVSVEFAYLDYLLHPKISLRGGLMLIPMGFINEIHEPPFYHGNIRPDVERVVIPSTWRELGLGIFGEPLDGLTYKLYLVTGFNAEKFSPTGWRSGRQKGGRALAEDFAVVARLDYNFRDLVTLGGSVYYGGADHDRLGDLSINTLLVEGHLQARWRGLELRVLGSYGTLNDPAALTLKLFPGAKPGDKPVTKLIGSAMYGFYAEVAYDLWPLLSNSGLYLAPFFRIEKFDTQLRVPTIPGRSKDDSVDRMIIDAGVTFKPHPQVVLKVNYRDETSAASADRVDSLYFGAGFVY